MTSTPPALNLDHQWLEQLFRQHHSAVLAYATRRVGPDRAEDVVAAVFTAAWRQRDQVPEPQLPWLYRAAHYEVLMVWRSAARHGQAVQRLAGLAETHCRTGPDHEGFYAEHEAIQAFLALLPERDAEILMLTAFEDLDPPHIAAILGCSTAAVRVRLHRARRRARALLAAPHELPALSAPTRQEDLS